MYKTLLLSIDLQDSASWTKALPTALALCKTFDATLHMLTVVPELPSYVVGTFLPENTGETLVKTAHDELAAFATERCGDQPVKTHVMVGGVYASILALAEDLKVDLIVMGSHRPEMSDYLLGPNAARVVRHSDCSVMVVRADS